MAGSATQVLQTAQPSPNARHERGRAVIRGCRGASCYQLNRSYPALAALFGKEVDFVKTGYKFMGNKWLISTAILAK
jgi:hypothetical protein